MFGKFCSSTATKNCAVFCLISKRSYCQEIRALKNPDLAYLRRGTGGRSSFNGNIVTVFGATGFAGKYVCSLLGKRGAQLIIPYRCDPDDYTLKRLKLCGDLGQVLFQPFDLRDPVSIRKAIKYSNAVINLIGNDFETRNFNFYDVHVKGAMEIARACREVNVERLIHFSALNVTQPVKRHYIKKIQFLPSKLEGEQAVMDEFPNATIFRPSNMYGIGDRFLWPIANGFRSTFLSIPLYKSGKQTVKQPVFASDMALGVLNAINDYDTKGKIFQIVGPERYYLADIACFCAQLLQRHHYGDNLVHDIMMDPIFLAKILFSRYGLSYFFFRPKLGLSFEQIERESQSDFVDPKLPTLEDLGVTPSKMDDIVPQINLKGFNAFTHGGHWAIKNHFKVDSLSSKAVKPFNQLQMSN